MGFNFIAYVEQKPGRGSQTCVFADQHVSPLQGDSTPQDPKSTTKIGGESQEEYHVPGHFNEPSGFHDFGQIQGRVGIQASAGV